MKVEPVINEKWKELLHDEFNKEYFVELKKFLIEEKKNYTIYPPGGKIFAAFDMTIPEEVKVVILGQDPYHGKGQAHGLCFSVPDEIPQPPSLVNIFKELETDLNIPVPKSGNLERWAKQGVLLLNTTLTVREGQALSHQNRGWEIFTSAVIKKLSSDYNKIVFLLWGKHAQSKEELIDKDKHFILKAAHPSPFSVYRGFYGCRHFSKCNEILINSGRKPINW